MSWARALSVIGAAAVFLVESTIVRGDQITQLGVAVLEDFNSLASSGTSSTLPKDWTFVETGSSANTTYAAGTGSSSTGDTYSFGAAASERALGAVASGSLQSMYGSRYSNATGETIVQLDIAFDGEQWRSGGPASGTQRTDFQYSLNATSLSTGTWIDVDALDILSVVNNQAAGALDGNANKASYAESITNLNITPGASFWVRFVDGDDTSSDHGLAVDNFSVTAFAAPEPASVLLSGMAALALAGLEWHRNRTMRVRRP